MILIFQHNKPIVGPRFYQNNKYQHVKNCPILSPNIYLTSVPRKHHFVNPNLLVLSKIEFIKDKTKWIGRTNLIH